MSIEKYSLEQINALISAQSVKSEESIRILFVPASLNDQNIEQASYLYALIKDYYFDNVVIAETSLKETKKAIPMPTASTFNTIFGSVDVNDLMRNDFCDEDDDFYIDDHAFNDGLVLKDHLMMLQAVHEKFKVVSIQICSQAPSIVREFAYVLSELMEGRSSLLIIPCDLQSGNDEYQKQILDYVKSKDYSNLFNLLNSEDSQVVGVPAFIGGVLIADAWELEINFIDRRKNGDSYIAGFASRY